jgi:hypothetical protein
MFLNNTLHYVFALISNIFLPLLLLSAIGLALISVYDLAIIDLTAEGGLLHNISLSPVIPFVDPLHTLIASAAVAVILVITSGFDNR